VTLLARILMHRPLVRQIVRQRAATISGGRTLRTWNDLLSSYPGIFGVKTGTPRRPAGTRSRPRAAAR
jgi:D-alanyl-D-alanine carboxypeptidase